MDAHTILSYSILYSVNETDDKIKIGSEFSFQFYCTRGNALGFVFHNGDLLWCKYVSISEGAFCNTSWRKLYLYF